MLFGKQKITKIGNYTIGPTLGTGSFGKVKLGEHESIGHKVAIKIFPKERIKNKKMEERIKREIQILKLFRHPHVIRLYEVIETERDIYVIMEYVSGGELFDYIVERGRLEEKEARRFFQQIISGIEYCHKHMVVHRDLKPENLLLDSHLNVKIADFGLSNIMKDGSFLKSSVGSPNYAAPEVISGKLYVGPEVDVWSCGVILYALLCGKLPFDEEKISTLFKKIRSSQYVVPRHVTRSAKDLINKILVVDPLKRMKISEIRNHPWFKKNLPPYLSIAPVITRQGEMQIDKEVLNETKNKIKTDKTCEEIIEDIKKNKITEDTVAYFLLLDTKLKKEIKEQNSKIQQQSAYDWSQIIGKTPPLNSLIGFETEPQLASTPEFFSAPSMFGSHRKFHPLIEEGILSSSFQRHNEFIMDTSVPLDGSENKWDLGLITNLFPNDAMNMIYGILKEKGFCWKIVSDYKIEVKKLKDDKGVKVGIEIFRNQNCTCTIDFQRVEGNIFSFIELGMFLKLELEKKLNGEKKVEEKGLKDILGRKEK